MFEPEKNERTKTRTDHLPLPPPHTERDAHNNASTAPASSNLKDIRTSCLFHEKYYKL